MVRSDRSRNAARDAPRPKSRTQSVRRGVPTQSVGTIKTVGRCPQMDTYTVDQELTKFRGCGNKLFNVSNNRT